MILYLIKNRNKIEIKMADMEHLTSVYRDILTLYSDGKKRFYNESFHGMSADEFKKLDEQIVCEFLAKLGDYVQEFTAARETIKPPF
jgi:hypothetical protein